MSLAQSMGVSEKLFYSWKNSDQEKWMFELVWKLEFNKLLLTDKQGPPTKRFMVLLDLFLQSLMSISGCMNKDYDVFVIHIIKTIMNSGTFLAINELSAYFQEKTLRQNLLNNLTWELFVNLYKQIQLLCDEMYYGIKNDDFYTKCATSRIKFDAEKMEDEVMAYLYRPGGFLSKCACAHFMSMQENC